MVYFYHKGDFRENSMKKIVIFLLLVIILTAGGIFAYTNKKWPFAESTKSTSTHSEPLEITKTNLEKGVLNISLKKNALGGGYCVLTLNSKRAELVIDDSKSKHDSKFKDCTGWNVGTKSLPAGSYTATVVFHGKDDTFTATKQVDIK